MIKVLSWNIKNFSTKLTKNTPAVNRVLDLVHPAAGREYDVFVIIEPVSSLSLQPGDLAYGDGPIAIDQLLAKLLARDAGWRAAPPRILANGSKAETLGVLYHSAKVTLKGPLQVTGMPGPWNASQATPGKIYWINAANDRLRRADADGSNAADVVSAGVPRHPTFDPIRQKIVWFDSGNNRIREADPDGTNPQNVVTGVNNVTHLTADGANQRIFWVEGGNRIRLHDAGGVSNVVTGIQPVGIRVDAAYDEVYWSDAGSRRVRVAYRGAHGYNDNNRTAQRVGAPVRLRVDLDGDRMFWTEAGGNLIACFLDGSSPVAVVQNATLGDLAFDGVHKKVYWVEGNANPKKIRRADYDGSNVEDVRTEGNPDSLLLDPAGGKIYWVNLVNDRLRRADLDGSNPEDVINGEQPRSLTWAPGEAYSGQAVFRDAFNQEIVFPQAKQRRPYLVRFEETGTGNYFRLLAAHSPSPHYSSNNSQQTGARSNNRDAREGTRNLGSIREITVNRGGEPVVVVGDFNSCTMHGQNPACSTTTGGHQYDPDAQDGLRNAVGHNYATHIQLTRTSMSPVNSATTARYTVHAFDHILTIGFTTVAHAEMLDLVDDVKTAWQGANVGVNLTPKKFRDEIYKEIYRSGGGGISDHLPVKAELTI